MTLKIRYYGHFQQQTGYGRAAMELAYALDRHQIAHDTVLELRTIGPGGDEWRNASPVLQDMFEMIDAPDVIIVHTLPLDCARVLEFEGLRRRNGPKLIAYTTWEAIDAPRDVAERLYSNFDQVWVPSAVTARALGVVKWRDCGMRAIWQGRPDAMTRTHVIPHCYDPDAMLAPGVAARYGRREAQPPTTRDRFRFYWIGAWTARKNPLGLIRAFAMAFGTEDAVEIVMHSPGTTMQTFVSALASTGLTPGQLPRITLSNQHLSPDAIARMHADADCFITASRGEAWNLPAFDAMLAGRHVIAQHGLGSDEFLMNTSADLIEGYQIPAHVDVLYTTTGDGSLAVKVQGAQGLTSRSLWLEPDLCELANIMRGVFEDRTREIKVHYEPLSRFGYAAVSKLASNVMAKDNQ